MRPLPVAASRAGSVGIRPRARRGGVLDRAAVSPLIGAHGRRLLPQSIWTCSSSLCWRRDSSLAGLPELRPPRVAISSTYAVVLAARLLRDINGARAARPAAPSGFSRGRAVLGRTAAPGVRHHQRGDRSRGRTRRLTTYAVSAALTIAALHAIGGGVNHRAGAVGRSRRGVRPGTALASTHWYGLKAGGPLVQLFGRPRLEAWSLASSSRSCAARELANAGAPLLLIAALAIGVSGVMASRLEQETGQREVRRLV